MRRTTVLVVAVLAALTGCSSGTGDHGGGVAASPGGGGVASRGGGGAGVAASCAGPTLTVSPTTVHPGQRVLASGEWYAADCYDMGQQGTPPALTGMTLQLVQGDRVWTVARGVDATGERDAIAVPVTVPTDVRPGPATIRVLDRTPAVTIRVTG